uniref:ER lumen protein-retaining receptor 2 n=1 Tax=Sus scrofa TaxID=9823 RepID=A0A480GP19_PIG
MPRDGQKRQKKERKETKTEVQRTDMTCPRSPSCQREKEPSSGQPEARQVTNPAAWLLCSLLQGCGDPGSGWHLPELSWREGELGRPWEEQWVPI